MSKFQIVALSVALTVGSTSFVRLSAEDTQQEMINALYRLTAATDGLSTSEADAWRAALENVRIAISVVRNISYAGAESYFAGDTRAVTDLLARPGEISLYDVKLIVTHLRTHLKEAFEQVMEAEPRFRRGDVNVDLRTDVTDVINLLDFLFIGGTRPGCMEGADANDDGSLNIGDPVSLLSYLFFDSSGAPAPWGACGKDPTPDSLGCEIYSSCPPVDTK